jgi:hypothetical protein
MLSLSMNESQENKNGNFRIYTLMRRFTLSPDGCMPGQDGADIYKRAMILG